jgi:hypothetical protein
MELASCASVPGVATQPPCHDVVTIPLWIPALWVLGAVLIIFVVVVAVRFRMRPRHPDIEFGCDYCADDQNRWFGHVTQIGSSEESGLILLRCPRCGALYEDSPVGVVRTRRLTASEAADLYPGSVQ